MASLSACQRVSPPPVTLSFDALGTLIDVTVWDATPPDGERLIAVERTLRDAVIAAQTAFHAWQPSAVGEASEALRRGERFHPAPRVAALLDRALDLAALSEGAFDPSIGEAVAAWGFHADPPAPRRPTDDWLAEWRADPPDHRRIVRVVSPPPLDPETRPPVSDASLSRSPASLAGPAFLGRHPRLKLDFGGIAKGEVAITLLDILRRDGWPAAIVSLGGDLVLYGRPGADVAAPVRAERGRDWRIALRAPIAPPPPPSDCETTARRDGDRPAGLDAPLADGGLIGAFALPPAPADRPHALFTSGVYERGAWVDCTWVHHLIDPALGRPVRGVQAATVWHNDAVLADAAASALLVAAGQRDPVETPHDRIARTTRVAARLGVTHWIVVLDDGSIFATRADDGWFVPRADLAERVVWLASPTAPAATPLPASSVPPTPGGTPR